MTHQHHIPAAPLGRFIAGFTWYKGYQPQHRIDRYLPNGNIEIILDLTDTPKWIYDNETLAPVQSFRHCWISGLREEYITIPSGAEAEMFIIEFRKGMVHPFLGIPLTEITGRVVEGEDVLHPAFHRLRELLLAAETSEEKFRIAEVLLQETFIDRLIVNPFVEYAVNRILAAPAATTIKSIAGRTGFSTRHFIRLFADHVGVTPKSFLRIIRFHRAVTHLQHRGPLSWSSLAVDCGYYDQSHFIADFRQFSGFTPAEYERKNSGRWPDYIPVG